MLYLQAWHLLFGFRRCSNRFRNRNSAWTETMAYARYYGTSNRSRLSCTETIELSQSSSMLMWHFFCHFFRSSPWWKLTHWFCRKLVLMKGVCTWIGCPSVVPFAGITVIVNIYIISALVMETPVLVRCIPCRWALFICEVAMVTDRKYKNSSLKANTGRIWTAHRSCELLTIILINCLEVTTFLFHLGYFKRKFVIFGKVNAVCDGRIHLAFQILPRSAFSCFLWSYSGMR